MSKYIRLSKGFNKYEMVPASEDIYQKIDKNIPHYKSLYFYEDTHIDQYNKTKSVAGIRGLKTDKLIFDFDSSSDINSARKDALTLCGRLLNEGVKEDDFRIYFSGSKGFHIELKTQDEFNRQEYESILNNLAGDLPTLDKKVTDEQRLFRIPLTKHQKTGLYKIPISFTELSHDSIESITEKAKEINLEQMEMVDSQPAVELPPKIREYKKIVDLKTDVIKPEVTLDNETGKYTDLDFTRCPKHMRPERWALAQGYFEAGERNEALHVLATTYRALGYTENETFYLLKAAADNQAKRTGQQVYSDKEIHYNIIKHVFSPLFKGGMYTIDNSEILRKTIERCNLQVNTDDYKINRIDKVADRFIEYAKNIRFNTLKTGIKELDENVMLTTGMLVGILGSPGSGKTSVANLIVENMSKNGEHVIYHSMDMFETLIMGKFLCKYTDYSLSEIFNIIEENKPDQKLEKAFDTVKQNLKHVHIDSRTGVTVEDIEQSIINYQEAVGVKPRLVVVDYLEKVHAQFTDPTHRSGYVASKISDLAKKHDVCIILLLQPQKSAGDPSEPLLSMRKVKGASVIEQDCRVILTMWRPGFNPKDSSNDRYASMAVVKNNMGGLNQFDFKWNGLRGEITSMTYQEQKEFEQVLKEIDEARQEEMDEKKKFDPWS